MGLIVEEVGKPAALGCAPDLLLKVASGIVPVEIKSLIGLPVINSDYERALTLGLMQVQRCSSLLKEACAPFGLLIFCYVRETPEKLFEFTVRGRRVFF